jgi:hypothetical protein
MAQYVELLRQGHVKGSDNHKLDAFAIMNEQRVE